MVVIAFLIWQFFILPSPRIPVVTIPENQSWLERDAFLFYKEIEKEDEIVYETYLGYLDENVTYKIVNGIPHVILPNSQIIIETQVIRKRFPPVRPACYLIDLKTGNYYPLLETNIGTESYALSPDGEKVVFAEIEYTREKGYIRKIYLLEVKTKSLTKILEIECRKITLFWLKDTLIFIYFRYDEGYAHICWYRNGTEGEVIGRFIDADGDSILYAPHVSFPTPDLPYTDLRVVNVTNGEIKKIWELPSGYALSNGKVLLWQRFGVLTNAGEVWKRKATILDIFNLEIGEIPIAGMEWTTYIGELWGKFVGGKILMATEEGNDYFLYIADLQTLTLEKKVKLPGYFSKDKMFVKEGKILVEIWYERKTEIWSCDITFNNWKKLVENATLIGFLVP